MWSSERPRRLAFLTLAVTLSACATEPAPQPAPSWATPSHEPAPSWGTSDSEHH